MYSWREIADYITDNLQMILLLIIGLKIGGKILKTAAIIISVIVFAAVGIGFFETITGIEVI